jgi:predicted aldo/keto reductase-like oxidoreductase
MERRSFLKTVGGAVGAGALNAGMPEESGAQEQADGLPQRVLGRTGSKISIVGFPGLSLTHDDDGQDKWTEALQSAFEKGVNYFDNAPAYGRGKCETRMGIGMQGIDRDKYFLSCKTKMRDKDGARKEMENSLKELKTDHFDLYQMHCLIKPQEVHQAFGKDGCMETIFKAKEEGMVKHIGFSAHTTVAALEALKHYSFDTVMFPINFVEYYTFNFGKAVLDMAEKQGAAVLAIKPMCGGDWPDKNNRARSWWYKPLEDDSQIDLALRFTLSMKPVVAGIPPAFLDLAAKAIETARTYKPITDIETEKVRRLAAASLSVFRSRQEAAAYVDPQPEYYVDNPHEGCPGQMV